MAKMQLIDDPAKAPSPMTSSLLEQSSSGLPTLRRHPPEQPTPIHSPRPTIEQPTSDQPSGMSALEPVNASNPSSRPQTPLTKSKTLKPATPQGAMSAAVDALQPLASSGGDASRPLNVTDALSYLDAVKVQFQDKPEVYNHFLDIMKDFKSQMIDTPGVIERVSMLFHGNPLLIQGFNTFLPPGYRIDLTADTRNNGTITVTTPMGVIAQSTGMLAAPMRLPREPQPSLMPGGGMPSFSNSSFGPPLLPIGLGAGSRPATPITHIVPHNPSAFVEPPISYSPAPAAQTAAAANVLGNLGSHAVERPPAGEFNHAIQYLNKIKLRYNDEPDTYKQFLEILQTYQKEQRHLQDSQVYAQVSMLFKNAPDLMEEFKDFLPSATNPSAQHAGLIGIMPHPAAAISSPNVWDQAPETPLALTAGSEKGTKAPARRRKRATDKDAATGPKAGPSRVVKRAKHTHKPDGGSPKFSSYDVPPSPPLMQTPTQQPARPQATFQPPLGQTQGTSSGLNISNQEELLFFDRTKRALESSGHYDEFLRLLGLFANDIIDTKTLIERAEVFLGVGDLMVQFKDLVGWDDKYGDVEHGPPGSIRTCAPDPLAPRNPEDGEGPSYRRLPDAEIKLACSGRDQLARSVLNDEWVSHPIWASEESGFIAHKKTVFEDTLHRCEEERHEYQVHIEALVRTITVLEPLESRIEEMSAEERSQFRLKSNLGGTTRTIYEKTFRKVYGRDAAAEVMRSLQECPAVAVPVVLARLKQKCIEWKRNQREWNKTWKEVDAKNFYKALDHQGSGIKANDKKLMTVKNMVQEIEAAKSEQLSVNGRTGAVYHLQFEFADTGVLHDSLKMIYSFLDHSQSQYSSQERRSVERFLRSFVPVLFMFSSHEFNEACGPLEPGHDDDHLDEADRPGQHSVSATHSSSGVPPGDLRKRLLKTVQENAPRKGTKESSSRSGGSSSPAPGSPLLDSKIVDGTGSSPSVNVRSIPEDTWIREIMTEGYVAAGDTAVPIQPFFANTTFYTLLRLLQLLYSRLLICKEVGARHAREKHTSLLANPVAVDLGLDDPQGPAVVLSQIMDAVRSSSTASGDENILYMYLLEACEKYFENDMDYGTFEEHLRWFFGTKAYYLFTIDRMIAAIVKQVQTIVSDHKCQEIWELLQKNRDLPSSTIYDVVRYRREAEHNVGSDDHLYRVDWDVNSRSLRIQLMGSEEPSVAGDGSKVERWREYVATYTMQQPTEWVKRPNDNGKKRTLFLRR
ncbi:hypothetical protein C8Q75DRAFT_776889 [Abortiporus biennis]|nr:hypothetical protein C8Q75DRAFT_776889 [Abortiporus biennis]